MRHVSIQQLSAFLDGALVGVSRELVTRHLTACAHCRERHAGWRANDDALRRALSWEPDDRTLEEWSSRVEMTLMAERKGLPPPVFSELHHPVIGKAAPEAERLDIVVQSVRRTRRGTPAAAEPLPVEAAPAVEAHEPVAEPQAKAPPWSEVDLPGPAHEPEPVRTREPEPAPTSEPDHFPDPPPPPRQHRPQLEVIPGMPALTGRPAPPSRRARPLLFLVSGLLLLVIAGSPLVPEVIRIPLPERWRWRLPRVEFVRRDRDTAGPSAPAPATQLATRLPDVSVKVPQVPVAAPAQAGRDTTDPTTNAVEAKTSSEEAAADGMTPGPDSSGSKPAAEKPRAKATARRPTRSIVTERATPPRAAPRKAAPRRPETEPEPAVSGVESPGTFIPSTRVTTTVQAVPPPTQAAPPPAPTPAPAPPAESEEDWPLLCGTVLDAAGAPLEGARVVLPANALTVRTDRRGRFCVACPPGTQGLRVEAAGHQPFSRTVQLSTGMAEVTIALTRSP